VISEGKKAATRIIGICVQTSTKKLLSVKGSLTNYCKQTFMKFLGSYSIIGQIRVRVRHLGLVSGSVFRLSVMATLNFWQSSERRS